VLRQRLERTRADADLPAEANASDLTCFVTTVAQGMAVQAAGGASREDLRRAVDMALRAWPTCEATPPQPQHANASHAVAGGGVG
jgi:hypothetical protein